MFRASRSAEQVRVEPAPRLGSGAEGRVLLLLLVRDAPCPQDPERPGLYAGPYRRSALWNPQAWPPEAPSLDPPQMADQFPCCEETLGCQERQSFTSYFSLWFEITGVKQFHVAATDVISGPDLLFQLKR